MGQLAVTIDETSALTALSDSLNANDLSEEDQGRTSAFDRVVADLMEVKNPFDGLSINVENSLQKDVGKDIKPKRDDDFQPKAGRERKKSGAPKKSFDPSLSIH